MTTHLELLRTIVTHTVHEPPPGKLLVGQEAKLRIENYRTVPCDGDSACRWTDYRFQQFR
jgi:hypothetical protein